MSDAINQSQFFMWRALFALAHADNIVTKEEIEFMAHILEGINFSDTQTLILKDDIVNAKDIEFMFKSITDQNDRVKFFDFARDLVWVDGDFGSEEQSVMIALLQAHVKDVNVDELIGNVSIELEEDTSIAQSQNADSEPQTKKTIIDMLSSFRQRFF